jgi:hypothetical protein
MNEIPPVTKPASRKVSGQSALSYTKFTSEVKIVADPAKVTGLKPSKDDSQLEPPPQPIPEVQIVDEPKPDPVANLEQPILEAYLEQHILEDQQQNEGPAADYVPEDKDNENDSSSSSDYKPKWTEKDFALDEIEDQHSVAASLTDSQNARNLAAIQAEKEAALQAQAQKP